MLSKKVIPCLLRYLTYLILLIEINIIRCGQINGWDIIVDFTNRDLISKYTFVFNLETNLDKTDLIRINMPYSLHSTQTGSTPDQLTAYLGKTTYTTCTTTSEDITADPDSYIVQENLTKVDVIVAAADPVYTGYFIRLNEPLLASVEYVLVFKTSKYPNVGEAIEIKNFVQIFTVSDIGLSSEYIVYDKNELFSTFALTTPAQSSLIVDYEVTASNQLDFLATYEVFIDLMNIQDAQNGSLYEIEFDLAELSPFQFISSNDGTLPHLCKSVGKKANSYVVLALPSTSYTCLVRNSKISIQVFDALKKNSRLRFSFFVSNPIYAFQTGDKLKVKRLNINSRNVIELGSTIAFLMVQGISLDKTAMKIGWGLDETVTASPNNRMPLMKNAPTGIDTYNSIQFQFTLQKNTPSSLFVELEFNIGTVSNGQAQVLLGSIIHNFPEIQGNPNRVECGVINDGSTRIILCKNIGAMQAKKQYFIGFKIMFINTAVIHSNFSQLAIYLLNPQNSFQRYPDAIVPPTKISQSSTLSLVQNVNFYMTGSSNTAVSSQVVTNQASAVNNPFTDAVNGILGIVPEKEKNTAQKLVFCLSLNSDDITSINDSGPATAQQAGFYIVTNKNVVQFQQNSLAIDQYGNLQADQVISANTKLSVDEYQSVDLGQYSRLKIQTKLKKDIQNMFMGGMIFAVRNVFVRQHASLYGDDNSLDFYFFFYDNIQSYLPNYKFPILYNAYTINIPKPKNLRYSVVNYYGGVSVNNDGSNVPSFIRLAGYLSQTDFTDGNERIVVFFTGLDFFQDDSDATKINYSTQCSSSVGSVPTICRGYKSNQAADQNYLQMNRVEVQFPTKVPSGSGNPFELLIPVKTIVGITKITLFVATMKYHQMIPSTELEQAAMKNYFFQPSTVFRLTGSNNLQDSAQFVQFTSQQANVTPLSNNFKKQNILRIDSYGLDLTNTYVGELVAQLSVSARHTETATVVGTNTGSSSTQENGAGFTFVTSYDFRGTQQNFFWEGGLPSNIRKCLSFKYNQDSISNWRFGFFCAMETGQTTTVSQVNITNFQLPYNNGLFLPDSTSFAYSTMQGELASLQYGKQIIGNANEITVNLNSASPAIRLGNKNIRIIWTFKTTNPLPEDSYVRIEFKDPLKLTGINTSTCNFKISTPHTCTVSQPTGLDKVLLFQLTNCNGCQIPKGDIQILHYGNDAPTTPTSNNLFLVQTLTKDKVLIDQTHPSLGYPSYLTYNNLSSQKKLLLIKGILELDYPYLESETTLKVSFNTDDRRELLKSEQIILDLNNDLRDANLNTVNTQIYCVIQQNDEVNHNFSSAIVTNNASKFTVVFKVKNDISYSDQYYFSIICHNVRLPSAQITNSPTIALVKSDGTTQIQLSATISTNILQPSKLKASNTVTKSIFNTYGSFSTITFNFNSDSPVQGTNFFLIRFSNKYLPYLVQDASLQCQINNVVSPCSISSAQTLIVSNVPLSTSTFKIQVIGVLLPQISSAQLNTFFISLVNQVDENTLEPVKYSFIPDIDTLVQPTTSLQITGVQLANTNVKQENTLTFNFTFPQNYLVKDNKYKLLISFPTEWKYILQLLNSKITLRRLKTNTFLTLTSSISTYIDINLTWKDPTNTDGPESFTLVLSNIANPQNPLCILPRQWIFHVQNQVNAPKIDGRSVASSNQIPYFKFNFHKTKAVLNWKYPDATNKFTVNKGPFKTLITLTLENNVRFAYPIRISLKDESLFGLIPIRPFAQPGDSQLSFYIYAKSSTPTSNYVVYFSKSSDTFNQFSTVPICNIDLVQKDQQLDYQNVVEPFYVPKNGISNPLIIQFKDQGYIVTQDVKVTLTVLEGSTYGITVKTDEGDFSTTSTKTIKASNIRQNALFQFQADVSSIVGIQVYVQVTVNVVDPNDNTKDLNSLFGLPSNLLLEVNQISYSGVQFKISSSNLDSISANSILYRPSCPQSGTIYYKIQIQNVYSLQTSTQTTLTSAQYDALRKEIISNAETFANYIDDSPLQTQYGFAISNPDSQYTEIQINNLLSTKNYKIQSFCVNNFKQQSINILETSITMASNNGIIQKMSLQFSQALTLPEKIKLTCFISIFMHIPPASVYTDDKVTCESYQTQYDFGNSQSTISFVKQKTRNSLTIYFIPDWTISQDYVSTTVATAIPSPTFIFSLRKFVNDYNSYQFIEWDLALPTSTLQNLFPSITNVDSLVKVTQSKTYPLINEEYYVDINLNSRILNITNIRLSQPGFLYVGLDNVLYDLSKKQQYDSFSSYQLLEGMNYLDKPVTYGVQLTFGNQIQDSFFQFYNLEQTNNGDKYEVFMAVTEEDPSPFAMKSDLRKTSINNYVLEVISAKLLIPSLLIIISFIF